ncbi:FAD-dependent oxidoreductase [Pseudomonas sp. B15(2017)]|uniref:FAD-dependent oxidoreductase n=1 Tax=unclassified Pseudomonas TaxID=196821 RepID=UPI00111BF554|nr:FAD-dependent oxidoreductase [Pseudomonas sp. B15(2017)]MCX4219535.1 FAD-dependent oxidoreductase [Pseudomonas sp. MCal1]
MSETDFDAVIIGGGFYGCAIAIYLAKNRGFKRVLLVERESSLLQRASYNNQARVHNGYHYPRSFTTAYRSRLNLPKFVRDWPEAVNQEFTKLYAISRRNSKVTAKQFVRFCTDIGAEIQTADPAMRKLFEPRLIEDVYLVKEYAFNSTLIANKARLELLESGVDLLLDTQVASISKATSGELSIAICDTGGERKVLSSRYIFNCSYSGINQLKGDFPGVKTELKQEITEMALMKMPAPLADLGITVMDGPFFSLMPFPAKGLHTLSHVRYTPHLQWRDEPGISPYEKLSDYPRISQVDRMVRDVSRYLPSLSKAQYVESLFEVKTILMKNESDDGRPILFEKYEDLPRCFSILGGKIDNIYDVLEKLDAEHLD